MMDLEEQKIFIKTLFSMIDKHDYELPRQIIFDYYEMAEKYLEYLYRTNF
jgi:hypothetical protein